MQPSGPTPGPATGFLHLRELYTDEKIDLLKSKAVFRAWSTGSDFHFHTTARSI